MENKSKTRSLLIRVWDDYVKWGGLVEYIKNMSFVTITRINAGVKET